MSEVFKFLDSPYQRLVHLDMEQCNLGRTGAKFISKGLKQNYSLLTLNISNNKIEDEGAKHIASMIKNNRNLRSILIRWN